MNQPSSSLHIPCPNCSHDLRGIPSVDDLYRCPECGHITNLRTLAQTRKEQDRSWMRWMIAGLIALFLLAMILSNVDCSPTPA